ncbi:MAG: hypothetical protein WD060_08925 [Pirellulales bacterium]
MSDPPGDLDPGLRDAGRDGDDPVRLVSAWLDGEIDAAGVAALEARLAGDPAERRAVIDAVFLDAQLAEALSAAGMVGMIDTLALEAGGTAAVGRSRGAPWIHGLSRFAAGLIVAAVLVSFVAGEATWQMVRASGGGSARAALAEISRTRLAVAPVSAGATAAPLSRGRVLYRGRLAIASGAVELAFLDGPLVILEGPAEIELVAPDRAFLHRGVAVVRPPLSAEEFELETATSRVVGGRGGEFAVKVDAMLTTDVQVYRGEALVSAGLGPGGGQYPSRVSAGEAVRIWPRPHAGPEPLEFSERRFTRRVPDDAPGTSLKTAAVRPENTAARHASLMVRRARGPMTIDGVLDEWPAVPGFGRTRRGTAAAEWVEGWMMYDDQRLYVAARVGDPLPLRNSIDPDLDAGLVWQGGGLQIFLSGDRAGGWPADANGPSYYENRELPAPLAERVKAENPRLMTLIMTHHAPSRSDRLFLGRTVAGYRPETIAPDAYEGRFRPTADGRGYMLEYAIPWATLGLADDPPRSGDDLAAAWQLHYSDETGRLWRDQIVEIRNPAEPGGIFLFERAATWGRAEYR